MLFSNTWVTTIYDSKSTTTFSFQEMSNAYLPGQDLIAILQFICRNHSTMVTDQA